MAENNAKNFLKNLLGYFTTDRKPNVKTVVTRKPVTSTPLTAVKGIGKATATKLTSIGIDTVEKVKEYTVTAFVEAGSETGLSPTMLKKYYNLFNSFDNTVSS